MPQLVLDKFQLGMIDEEQLSKLNYPEGSCMDCQNILFIPGGAIAKRKGFDKMHTSAVANNSIKKIHQWTTTAGAEITMCFNSLSGAASAGIYSVTTTGTAAVFNSVLVTSGTWTPAVSAEPISVTTWGGSAVFTYNGYNSAPNVFDGATLTASILTAAPSGAKVVCGWGNYLFVGNIDTYHSRIRWCYPGNVANWPASYFIDLDPDDGDEIRAMVNFGNRMYVFKRYKMWAIHWVGGSSVFVEERIAQDIGCVGPNAWVTEGDTMYFIGDYTAYKFTGTGQPVSISDNISSRWNYLNMLTGWDFECDTNSPDYQIWFHVVDGTGVTKNLIYTYDTRFKSWTKYNISAASMGSISYGATMTFAHFTLPWQSYSIRYQDALQAKSPLTIFGTYDGFLKKYGFSSDDDGTAIDGYWTSRWLDFGTPDINKRIMRITTLLERYGNYNLYFYIYRNWNSFDIAGTYTASLSADVEYSLIEKRLDFTKQMRAFQLKVGTNTTGSPFILHKLIIDFLPKGRTLV